MTSVKTRKFWFSAVLLGSIAVFTLGPVFAILLKSFDISGIGKPFKFGFSGWVSLFLDVQNLEAFFWSFLLTIRVPIGLIVALLIAWLLVRVRVPGARYFEYFFWFAYFLPAMPLLTGWILLLDKDYGLLNSWLISSGLFENAIFNIRSAGGIIWAHLTLHTIPIMVILISPSMRMIDRSIDDAAVITGAGAFNILRKITFPLVLPALLVASTASWIKALESFEMEQILGVPAGIYVYSNKIYDFVLDEPPRMNEAMAMSVVFLIILISLGALYQFLKRGNTNTETLSDTGAQRTSAFSKPVKLAGAIFLTVFTFSTIGLPFIMLLVGSFMRLFGFFSLSHPWTTNHWRQIITSGEFYSASIATFKLGLATALPGTIIFAVIAWGILNMGRRMQSISEILVWLPWAFPGIILGVGLLEVSLFAPGFSALHGTIVPMAIGILIKQMPISVHLLRVSFEQINQDLVQATHISGARFLTIFTRILLPLNLPAVTAVFLIIFAAAVSEISVIVLIAPPDIQTLSILTFKYASQGQFEVASVLGTVVALLALFTSVLAFRLANKLGLFE